MVAAPTHFRVVVSSVGDAGVELPIEAERIAACRGRTGDDHSGIGHHLADSPRGRPGSGSDPNPTPDWLPDVPTEAPQKVNMGHDGRPTDRTPGTV